MKKAILFIGAVVFFYSATSCTAEDLDYDFKKAESNLNTDYNQSDYMREGDTIIATPILNIVEGNPIVKPKQG